jgi:hypothetical protein
MSNDDRTPRVYVNDMPTEKNALKNATMEYVVSCGSKESVIKSGI